MIHPCDRQTDGQTDGRAIAYNALSIYAIAICCRALKRVKMHHGETNLNKKKFFFWGGGTAPPPLGAFGTRVTVHFVLHTFYYLPAPMLETAI